MVTTNLTNLVLKTATTGNKLVARADRIGSGFAVVTAHDPAAFLSPGHFPMPRLPEPEQIRPRREVTDVMSMAPAGLPVGPTGSPSGAKVCRGSGLAEWLIQTDPPVQPVGATRASYPGSLVRSSRLGRDCQSPDRLRDARDRDAKPVQGWRRTAAATTATTK
jgi:hypothetical protein